MTAQNRAAEMSLEESIRAQALDEGVNPAVVALLTYRLPVDGPSWWVEPTPLRDGADVYTEGLDLIGSADNPLARYCQEMARSVQFPLATAYLHGIGVVASAMVHNHAYTYYGAEKPVTLYVVTAQPPSSGKSAVNSYLTSPIRKAVKQRNDDNVSACMAAKVKLDGLESSLKKAKNDNEREAIAEDVAEWQQRLAELKPYRYGMTDATPEALEHVAGSQGGIFTLISDEADAINVILGAVYGDKKANMGLFLSGWDGDYLSSARITRDGHDGHVSGGIAVIAQDESIDSILAAGLSGRGVSERFLMIRERPMLGFRDHTKYTPIDVTVRDHYDRTVKAIFAAAETTFYLSEAGVDFIRNLKMELEPTMAPGGDYSNSFLTGVIGKAEKQVIKIACVLHALTEYGAYRQPISREIDIQRLIEAVMIFNQCLQTYRAAADSKGFVGEYTEITKIAAFIQKKAEKKKMRFSFQQLRDGIKNTKPFSNQPNLSAHLKEKILPPLQDMGYLVYDKEKNMVHINPRLA